MVSLKKYAGVLETARDRAELSILIATILEWEKDVE
ncbi:hypothetical protein BG10_914 [Bacillus thuringiensis serovar morrisoni]|nr:hypothetical protein BG10_914 [Bacillus thuringiensis serovar morrisoni]